MSTPQPHPEAQFSAEWLALRAPADTAARAASLTALAASWLASRQAATGQAIRLADLGTGTGANARFLAPRLPGPQTWQLIDHDPALLDQAHAQCAGVRAANGRQVLFSPHLRRLDELARDELRDFDLVSAAALIDLVSDDWLASFALAMRTSGAATLIALSVDGRWRFSTPHGEHIDPDDAHVRAAFNDHQRRDKGVGGALGPDAAPRLTDLLRAQGHRVLIAPSPWQLRLADAQHAALARALLNGWHDAAREQCPDTAMRIADWHARRIHSLGQPDMLLEVGHVDLFACPPDTWPEGKA